MPNFYVIATPIGNLEDITFRAVRILKSVDLILCEDTRETKKLLSRYGISTPTESYHAHSKLAKIDRIIGLLKSEKDLALVSDAGTPSISDPGAMLISRLRKEFSSSVTMENTRRCAKHRQTQAANQLQIFAVPGPSALTAALSVSGIPASDFLFLGFLPHKKGRETLFGEIAASKRTVVFYESPHRLTKTLESLKRFVPKRKIGVARELTKIHEGFVSGTPIEISEYFNENKDDTRGEFVFIVSPICL